MQERLSQWRIGREWKQLLLLLVVVYIFINDNIYPGMRFIEEPKTTSPYSLGFVERYREAGKNFFAEHVLVPRNRQQLPHTAQNQAKAAWQYFRNNIDPKTGLVNTVDGLQIASAWDIASLLSALHSARVLQLIDKREFDQHFQTLINTLLTMPLVEDSVPNRYYNTATAKMIGFTYKEGAVGYSPIDVGRMLGWLYAIKQHYPEYAADVDKFVLRLNYCNLIDSGELFGGVVERGGALRIAQQGRLGYEEYAAKGFFLWGFDTHVASRAEPIEYIKVAGQDIPLDTRNIRDQLEKSFVVPDSYFLDGLEYHWDAPDDNYTPSNVYSDSFTAQTAQSIYQAQRLRFESTGLLTARSELQLTDAPFLVYDAVVANGTPWQTIDDLGRSLGNYSALSTRSVFSMWALWDTPYTQLLFDRVANLYKEDMGFYEGVFESGTVIPSFSANTNAAVLSSFAFVVRGKPQITSGTQGLWEYGLKQAIQKRVNPQCYPLTYVCTDDCDQVASLTTDGFRAKQLREVEANLKKLESQREELLKPFEIVQ